MKPLRAAPVVGACAALGVAVLSATAADDARLKLGRQLFGSAVPACALCHTLADAGAEGAVGPSLDELKPDAARVVQALRTGIGQMPSYNGKLTEAEIEALAAYVAKASGAGR